MKSKTFNKIQIRNNQIIIYQIIHKKDKILHNKIKD